MTLSIGNVQSLYTDFHTSTSKMTTTKASNALANDKVTLGWQQPPATYQHIAPTQTAETTVTAPGEQPVDSDYLQQLLQAMLDQRTGLDRKKWEELQEKIEALQSLDELTDSQKTQLEQLLKAQEALMKEAVDRMREQAEQPESS